MSDEYPTVYLQGGGVHAEFVIANPELPGGTYVPVSELRELIEHFRDMAEKTGPEEFKIAYTRAADELEEPLND